MAGTAGCVAAYALAWAAAAAWVGMADDVDKACLTTQAAMVVGSGILERALRRRHKAHQRQGFLCFYRTVRPLLPLPFVTTSVCAALMLVYDAWQDDLQRSLNSTAYAILANEPLALRALLVLEAAVVWTALATYAARVLKQDANALPDAVYGGVLAPDGLLPFSTDDAMAATPRNPAAAAAAAALTHEKPRRGIFSSVRRGCDARRREARALLEAQAETICFLEERVRNLSREVVAARAASPPAAPPSPPAPPAFAPAAPPLLASPAAAPLRTPADADAPAELLHLRRLLGAREADVTRLLRLHRDSLEEIAAHQEEQSRLHGHLGELTARAHRLEARLEAAGG